MHNYSYSKTFNKRFIYALFSLGDFHPRPPICPSLEKILRSPMLTLSAFQIRAGFALAEVCDLRVLFLLLLLWCPNRLEWH